MSISVETRLFSNMKRSLCILFSIWVLSLNAAVASAQTEFFNSVRPQASLVIKKHTMGADLVEVTVLGSQYAQEDLREKIEMLGQYLGDPTPEFVKATFAINGLINVKDPVLNLAPIAKAFAFGNKPLKSLSVFFENVIPSTSIPARWFAPADAWMLEGMATANPKGIEYRIEVNTKDLELVSLPGSEAAKGVQSTAEIKKSPDFVLIGALLVGAIAVGLLVYSALIRPRPHKN
jgi:hypothetical protein